MKRLTHKRSNGIKAGYWSPERKDAIIQRLGEYEDFGLTPKQLAWLHDRYITPRMEGEVMEAVRE